MKRRNENNEKAAQESAHVLLNTSTSVPFIFILPLLYLTCSACVRVFVCAFFSSFVRSFSVQQNHTRTRTCSYSKWSKMFFFSSSSLVSLSSSSSTSHRHNFLTWQMFYVFVLSLSLKPFACTFILSLIHILCHCIMPFHLHTSINVQFSKPLFLIYFLFNRRFCWLIFGSLFVRFLFYWVLLVVWDSWRFVLAFIIHSFKHVLC